LLSREKKREVLVDFKRMINDAEFSDITFIVEDDRIYSHKSILAARSAYFKRMFSGQMRESKDKEVLMNGDNEDWVRSAVLRTVNIHHNLLVNWWMGYLNLQIEHHLFPSMPQFRGPVVSPRIKALVTKHGLHYDERGYWEVCYAMFKNLHDVGHGDGVGSGLRDKLMESKSN